MIRSIGAIPFLGFLIIRGVARVIAAAVELDFSFNKRSSVEFPALDEPVHESKSEDAGEVYDGVIHLVAVSRQF